MAVPKPQLGLVISYAYLWHHEHLAGRDEGRKDRPCVIVVAAESAAGGGTIVRVLPMTHTMPGAGVTVVEIPAAVKRHLGLDWERSWVVLDELNEFVWPGFDLRPVPGARDRFDYGFIPPRLFAQIMVRLKQSWAEGIGRDVPRG